MAGMFITHVLKPELNALLTRAQKSQKSWCFFGFTVFQSTGKHYHAPPQWTLCIWNALNFLHQPLQTSGTLTNPSFWLPEWKLLKSSKGHYDWNIQSDDATIRIMKPLEDLLHWVENNSERHLKGRNHVCGKKQHQFFARRRIILQARKWHLLVAQHQICS